LSPVNKTLSFGKSITDLNINTHELHKPPNKSNNVKSWRMG